MSNNISVFFDGKQVQYEPFTAPIGPQHEPLREDIITRGLEFNPVPNSRPRMKARACRLMGIDMLYWAIRHAWNERQKEVEGYA